MRAVFTEKFRESTLNPCDSDIGVVGLKMGMTWTEEGQTKFDFFVRTKMRSTSARALFELIPTSSWVSVTPPSYNFVEQSVAHREGSFISHSGGGGGQYGL